MTKAARTHRPRSNPVASPRDRVTVVVAALLLGLLVGSRVPGFTTDSESYLDVARSLLAGQGLVQHVADFWRPGVPDPLGLWPPLYPLVTAGLARLGAPLEVAARLVSALSFPVFALLFLSLATELLGAGVPALAITLVALSTLAVAFAASMAWSEMLYLALSTGALLGLVRVAAPVRGWREATPLRLAVLAGALAGLAALTRYIGVILIPVGLVWLLLTRVPTRTLVTWLACAALPPLAWTAHNLARFGNVLGPGLPQSHASVAGVAAQLLPALRWGFVPWPVEVSGPASALFVTGLVALGAFAWVIGGPRALVAGYVAAYIMMLVTLRANLTFNGIGYRYLTPVMPFLWLGAAAGLSWLAERMRFADSVARVITLATLVLCGVAVTRFMIRLPHPAPAMVTRRVELAELKQLILPAGGPVLGDAGHLVRSATGQDAIEIPPAPFAPRFFTELDETRWRAAGARQAVFRSESWNGEDRDVVRTRLEARFGPYLAHRLAPGNAERWPVADSGATFVRFTLP
jgi:Dolichyl-phosphate-mannose-protein mannosyltransferase